MSFSVSDTRRAAQVAHSATAPSACQAAIRREASARRGSWMKSQQQSTGAPGWLRGVSAEPVIVNEGSFNDRCVALLTLVDEAANGAWKIHRAAVLKSRRSIRRRNSFHARTHSDSSASSANSDGSDLQVPTAAEEAELQMRRDAHDEQDELPMDLIRFEFSIKWRDIRGEVMDRLRQYVALAQRLHGMTANGALDMGGLEMAQLRQALAMCAPEQIAAALSVMTLFNKEMIAASCSPSTSPLEADLLDAIPEMMTLSEAMTPSIVQARQQRSHARQSAIITGCFGAGHSAIAVLA